MEDLVEAVLELLFEIPFAFAVMIKFSFDTAITLFLVLCAYEIIPPIAELIIGSAAL